MKTIQSFAFLVAIFLSGIAYAATLTISGTVMDGNTAKSGVTVTWIDSSSSTTATAVTNSAGQYSLTLNTGSSTQGMAVGYITGCNNKKIYKTFFYYPRGNNYPGMNFSWCSGSGGGGAPFTASVSGTVTNLGTGSYTVYADTLGGQFPNWTDTVTQSSPNYSFSVTVLNDPQDIWVWIIDCRNDTLTQKVRVTSTRPTISQVNFNYCGTSGGGNRASLAGMVYKGNSFPNSGFVVLYSKGSGPWAIADTTRIQRGYYFFANLDSTKWYMVRAFLDTLDPDYKKYMPTYADSSAKWNKAWIGKNLQGFQNTRNIYLKKGKGKGNGPGNIRGNVIKGKSRADVPMEGVLVNLYENGVPVGFEVSDADGKFEFSDLDYGTYTIYPEETGLTTHSYDLTLSAATPSESGVLVTMEKTEIKVSKVSTGIDNTDLTSKVSVYPNPAHTSLKVDMGEFSGLVNLTIVDLNGRIIQSLQSEDALTEVNVSDLEDGIYFLSVETEGVSELIKIVKH